jgi:enolase
VRPKKPCRSLLQEGWVIANHILVSFHVAFISSVLAVPDSATARGEVLKFIFASHETLISAVFTLLVFHAAIAIHELGHFLEAARLRALSDSIMDAVENRLAAPLTARCRYVAGLFLGIPYGLATGVKREGLNYYPDAPYNLAVAAAGPRASRNAALVALPAAGTLLYAGLIFGQALPLYAGRLLLGLGLVTLLDFLLADPGKYREFRRRERQAATAAATVAGQSGWARNAAAARRRVCGGHMQTTLHPRLGLVGAPWQFRNCGMGGRHTEREYPESNISMQEAMFLILGAVDTQEAQEMTVRLQNRLKEILEKSEGCRVMGIGLEGGLAPYVARGAFELPELRLWAMMKQAIRDCGYRPGEDVAIALDPALSELELAYREEFDIPDSIGRYLFWRDHAKRVLDREEVLQVYRRAVQDHDIPILSIEDGFSEDDHEGWRLLLRELGEQALIVGDDLVTTNDRTIEWAADERLITTVLVKANQIGTLYETLLAVLVSLGKSLDIIVSHRSKSPNDDMEAHLALAFNALGLKAGGGANTERLVKYQAVAVQMEQAASLPELEPEGPGSVTVERIRAREEPTNAGIPTVGVDVTLSMPGAVAERPVRMSFHGATPLGTSSGTGEAVHLVDGEFERAEYLEITGRYAEFLEEAEPGLYRFVAGAVRARIEAAGDPDLLTLFDRARRYGGKGCLQAVDNVHQFLAPALEGVDVAGWRLQDIDQLLLQLELETAVRRGKLSSEAGAEERVATMQRKQNLGMNAILSVSLALARGVARVRGRELYELLREEALLIIESLAAAHGVAIAGSRFEDYVAALRAVNDELEKRGRPLHAALRELTGIYDGRRLRPVPRADPAASARVIPLDENPISQTAEERIQVLNRELLAAFGPQGETGRQKAALRCYLDSMSVLRQRFRMFEICNNRLFSTDDGLLVPYDAHGRLTIYLVRETGSEIVASLRLPHGTLVTDAMIGRFAGIGGKVIDLEPRVYYLDPRDMPVIQVARLRDMARVLQLLNTSGSRQEAMYLLRFLVARLCSPSYRGVPGAKNLQNEINRVREELVEFMNGPFAERMRLPSRILVRNISGLVSRPKLIDEVWQDTIDLAEIHVRGSSITNEIRRSAHHAMGRHTLALCRAYLQWLETGLAAFPDQEREQTGPQDEAARGNPVVVRLLGRIVSDLEQLLGTSQIAQRLTDWSDSYHEELLLCESGNSLDEELESMVVDGIRAGNRWIYQHRLRSLTSKLRDGAWSAAAAGPFDASLTRLQSAMPGTEHFSASEVEDEVRGAVEAFKRQICRDHEQELASALEELIACFDNGQQFESFELSCVLRARLGQMVGTGVFRSQRYLLHQLDCLLEEIGFLALRHVASDYAEHGIRLGECLRIVNLCAGNLHLDGLFSSELWNLSVMLINPGRAPAELLDVLEQIQRNYHRLVNRVSDAYKVMADHLGYDAGEMRGVLANFQRTMHDLNSLVHFSDLARASLKERGSRLQWPEEGQAGREPWDFIHLSHGEDIEGRVEDRESVSLQARYGGKGAGLIYISYLGIPTRDGFIVPTALPRKDLHRSERARLQQEIKRHLGILERDIARNEGSPVSLGDPQAPLLLAIRGGSVFSMPGMLSTVVFAGMTQAVAEELAKEDEWYAWDAFRRFLASYAAARWNMDLESLDLVEKAKRRHGVSLKIELPGAAMREVVESSKAAIVAAGFGAELDAILRNAELQVMTAVESVHDSWDRDRARRYRKIKHLSDGWHTAVIVQQMASGNRSNDQELKPGLDETRISLTGVIPYTRVLESGSRSFMGDIKFSACGDDLVGGVTASKSFESVQRLHDLAPLLERKLNHISARLRRYLGSDVEIEFTVERGVLSILQVRGAEVEQDESPRTFNEPGEAAGHGIGIRGGAFRGLVAFNEADVAALQPRVAESGDQVDGILLVLENPIPDEIPLILSVNGLLAARGGSTSHAAVAVHGITDKPFSAVLGVAELHVGKDVATITMGAGQPELAVRAGDILSIHGQTGELYVGSRPLLGIPAGPERGPGSSA